MAGGRPTKLTDELREKVALIVSQGNYVETAAAYCGVNKVTLYDWLRRGAKGDEPYLQFSHAIEKAMAQADIADIMTIRRAAETQWQAAAWRLERRNPKKWGRQKLDVEISGKDAEDDNLYEAIKIAVAGKNDAEV